MFTIVKKKVLNHIDMFNVKPTVIYDGKSSYKTTLSRIVSILIIITGFALLFNFCKELWQKENPNTFSYTEILTDKSPKKELNNDNFLLAFRLEDLYGENIKHYEKYIQFEAYYKNITVAFNKPTAQSNITLNIQKCSKLLFNDELLEFFKLEQELGTFYCISDLNSTIGGYYTYKEPTSFINIQIKACSNKFDKIKTCAPFEIGKTTLSMYLVQNVVSVNNYASPYIKKVALIWDFIDPEFAKVGDLFLKEAVVNTDDGLIFKENRRQSELLFHEYYVNYYSRDEGDSIEEFSYYTMNIYLSNERIVYKRSYLKLQTALANTLSLIKIILLWGRLVVKYFTKKILKLDMMNKTLHFEMADFSTANKKNKLNKTPDQGDESSKNDNKIISINEVDKKYTNTNEFTDESSSNSSGSIGDLNKRFILDPETNRRPTVFSINKIDKPTPARELQIIKLQSSSTNSLKMYNKILVPLKYSCCEIFKSVVCEKCCQNKMLKRKEKIFKKAWKVVSYNFDLLTFIKMNSHLDIIKHLMFNEVQKKSLNHLDKRYFNYKDYMNSLKVEKSDEFMANEKMEIQNYFLNCEQDRLNNKLMELLEQELAFILPNPENKFSEDKNKVQNNS
jgi:hypothetical protein